MVEVALSLIPVFTLIALGAGLRRANLLGADGWAALERLTYFVLFPPLLFMSIVGGSFAGGEALRLGLALATSVLIMASVTLLLRRLLPVTGPQFTSVFQAGIRWNSYVALGLISGLYGDKGLALSAVGFAVLVPINNLLSVLVLNRYAGTAPAPFARVLRSLATNPLILATLGASALAATGLKVSTPVADTLNLLGDATISLGLICVGAALDFSSFHSTRIAMAAGTFLRLIAMPALVVGMCVVFGVTGMSFSIAVLCVATPVATSAYILARQLGGDAPLMANMITLTTLLSLVTIPLALTVARMIT
jgi:malonate transporter and related proteins